MSMFFNQNKRKRLHKNRVQFPEDYLETPTWPPWLHVKTLYITLFIFPYVRNKFANEVTHAKKKISVPAWNKHITAGEMLLVIFIHLSEILLNSWVFHEIISIYALCSVFDLSEAVFQCLDVLLKLNHSLLEPQLEAIWVMLWKTGSSKGVAHGTLMFSLTSTYLKLRQVSAVESNFLSPWER